MNNFKKYLPSKSFITTVLFIIILIGLAFGVFFGVKGIISLFKKGGDKAKNNSIEITVGEVIQKDGNNNGIADWEEYLWGLDPNKNGPENKEFIANKKTTLSQSGDILPYDESKTIMENEILSREFFAVVMSLQQTGNLNEESIQSISDAIGQKIEATPIPDTYTRDMLTIKADSLDADNEYYNAFTELVLNHSNEDIGSELTLISQGLGNNDPQALYAAMTVASAYRSFGQELIDIPVPSSISNIHVSLANNYEKTAQSIEALSDMLLDPIIGMNAIINYKRYSDALVSDIDNLTEILSGSTM